MQFVFNISVISIPNNIPARTVDRTYDRGSWPQPDRTWPYAATITPPFQSVLSNHWELCVHTSPKWDPWTIHGSTISKIHIRIWIWIRRRILHKIIIKPEVIFFAESQLQHHFAPYFRLVSGKEKRRKGREERGGSWQLRFPVGLSLFEQKQATWNSFASSNFNN